MIFSHIQTLLWEGEGDCFALFYVHKLDDWEQSSSSKIEAQSHLMISLQVQKHVARASSIEESILKYPSRRHLMLLESQLWPHDVVALTKTNYSFLS